MDISELGKTPISENAPAGEDITYLPEFEELQNEIDKLTVVTAGAGQVDWNRVVELGTMLLSEKSKNLLVTAYMAEALMKTRQFGGFYQGTCVIKDLVENYWDSLYPPKKRKKGRINALKWWYDRAEKFLKNLDAQPQPGEMINEIKQNLTELDGLLAEKIDDAPILRLLVQYVDQIPVEDAGGSAPESAGDKTPQTEEKVETEEAPDSKETYDDAGEAKSAEQSALPQEKEKQEGQNSGAPSVKAPSAPIMSGAPESDKEANKALNSSIDVLARLARYYLKKNSANPLAYRLNRICAWLTIDSLPIVQENGKTPLPPPDPALKSALEDQLVSGDYENAVLSAEGRLKEHLFWLDLNRIAAGGLEALGGKYEPALEMVCRETEMFIKRLPGLEDLSFSDGTPFCDKQTKNWLRSISGSGASEAVPAAPAAADASEGRSVYAETEAEAKELVKNKKVVEAVQLFQENLARCGSGRENLLFRTGLCRLLINAGKVELALPHLKELEAVIDARGLEDWEPELALEGLHLIYAGFRDCTRDYLNSRAEEVLDRIAKVSPADAYRLAGT